MGDDLEATVQPAQLQHSAHRPVAGYDHEARARAEVAIGLEQGPHSGRVDDDLITVVVQDILTKGERSPIRDGKRDLVLETRGGYQQTMGADLTAGVEEITGRRVIAFLSANHLDPDIAIESFMLAPQNDGQPPPAEATRAR